MPERENLYRILQVDPEASPLVIQAAYRVLARVFHPDVEGDDEQMKRLNRAWDVLGNPLRRAAYDRERAGRHPGPVPAASSNGSRPPAPAGTPARPAASALATAGSTADGSTIRAQRPEDHAGPPRGEPFGPVVRFGRYDGWTLGQVVRVDRPWLEWFRNMPAARSLTADIDAVLRTKRGPGAVDERRHYEANQAKVHTWAPGAPTKIR